MGHDHSHTGNQRRLQIALVITALFTIVEAVGGLVTRSLALLADAGHMLTDSMALALAVFAFAISARPADRKRSFGYHRFQVLAAFVNGITLIAIVAWILIEAVRRLFDPPTVLGDTMLVIAVAGLVVNVIAFWILHGGDQDNLNMRGAALHVLSDLLGSVAAIAAAIVIINTGWMPIDAILSVVVAALIFRSAWYVVRHSAHILLEGAPEWLDVADIRSRLAAELPEVHDVHHVHVWGLTQQKLMLTMHLVLDSNAPDPTATIRDVKRILAEDYGIEHSTIEIETHECADE
ncbi:MAG: cation diffusion facilitator family transporter [Woeseiaceae bacterium]|nr:cation diffusion facilitator family transporter [Woeseiaceae bacterium]